MQYTTRELRLAILAVVLAVAVAGVLGWHFLSSASPPAGSAPQPQPANSGDGAAATSQAATTGPHTLKAEYMVSGKWKGGFNAAMAVTNLSSKPVEGWTVHLQLPPGVAVISAWSADVSQVAAGVTLRSQPWNTYLAPGATAHFGFQATGAAAAPNSCTINGAPC
jgi:cellulase/cellobiase CelA1